MPITNAFETSLNHYFILTAIKTGKHKKVTSHYWHLQLFCGKVKIKTKLLVTTYSKVYHRGLPVSGGSFLIIR